MLILCNQNIHPYSLKGKFFFQYLTLILVWWISPNYKNCVESSFEIVKFNSEKKFKGMLRNRTLYRSRGFIYYIIIEEFVIKNTEFIAFWCSRKTIIDLWSGLRFYCTISKTLFSRNMHAQSGRKNGVHCLVRQSKIPNNL